MPYGFEELGIVRVTAGESAVAARVLAEAFAEDPVFIWAMPRGATRTADAVAFFTFYLRRGQPGKRELFATSDRSAFAVVTTVSASGRTPLAGEFPAAPRSASPASDYFRWIESHRPEVRHRYLEFIGSSPTCRSKGQGSLLLKSLLAHSAAEGLPFWCWSSNLRNLPFYRRLGFEPGDQLCRDAETPAVTPLLRPPVPLAG